VVGVNLAQFCDIKLWERKIVQVADVEVWQSLERKRTFGAQVERNGHFNPQGLNCSAQVEAVVMHGELRPLTLPEANEIP
jgi:hypothetical protein